MTPDPSSTQNNSTGTTTTTAVTPPVSPPAATEPTKASTASSTTTTSAAQIPTAIAQKYPDLTGLINETESMTQEERDYWYQILPIMTDEQVEKLRGILVHEKEQLSKLDQEYEQELTKLNEKHLLEWKEHEAREKREQLRSAESQTEAEEAANEAALLAQLSAMDDSAPKA